MKPGIFNIEIFRGSTYNPTISGKVATVYIDFPVDYDSAELQIRNKWVNQAGIAAPLLTLSTANGGLVFDGTAMEIYISATDTAALAFNEGAYDLELTKKGDPVIVDKLLYGSVTVLGEKTV
jgi:hypothetical protein